MDYKSFFTAYCDSILKGSEEEREELVANNVRHFTMKFHTDFQNWLKKKDRKTYRYMLTFTIDPKKHPVVTDELSERIELYVRQQGLRKALQIDRYVYVKELHKNGRPHWHAVVESSKSLKKSLFKYYEVQYGNLDFSRTKGKTIDSGLNYISKSGVPTEVVA